MNWQTTYNPANVTISVVKSGLGRLVPAITWADPAKIVYGTVLSAAQLDAPATTPTNSSVSLAGTFSYNPPLGNSPQRREQPNPLRHLHPLRYDGLLECDRQCEDQCPASAADHNGL